MPEGQSRGAPASRSQSIGKRRTPCVGICSTTYGDLVCRGCKRFAHEITAWNGYDDAQRSAVWTRLIGIRDEVVSQWLWIADKDRFDAILESLEFKGEHVPERLFAVLTHGAAGGASLDEIGIGSRETEARDALAVMKAIDAELYRRGLAHYEHSFRVT